MTILHNKTMRAVEYRDSSIARYYGGNPHDDYHKKRRSEAKLMQNAYARAKEHLFPRETNASTTHK